MSREKPEAKPNHCPYFPIQGNIAEVYNKNIF